MPIKDAILYKVFYGGIIPSRAYLTTKLIYFKGVKIRLCVLFHCSTSLFVSFQILLNHRRRAGPAVADRAIVAFGHSAAHKLVLVWGWTIGASFELNVYAMVSAPGRRDKYIGHAGMYPLSYQPRSGALIA